ncbi:putative receptor-type adenylate cyclase, partial [Trypanosoma theileri]
MHFHTPKATGVAYCCSRTYFRPLLCLTALLCLIHLLVYTPHSALCQDAGPAIRTVKALFFNRTDILSTRRLFAALVAGFRASLSSHNFTVTDGIRVEIVKREATVDNLYNLAVNDLSKDNRIFVLTGIFGDVALQHVLPAIESHGVVAFAPFTGSSTLRKWNPHLYFTRAEPASELLALIRYAMNSLWVHRLGFMYLQNVSYGDLEFNHAREIIFTLGQNISGVFTVKSSLSEPADDVVFNATWEAFADTRPQAVIVFGSPIKDTAKFIKRMLTDKRTAGAYLLGPLAVQEMLLSVWREAVDAGVPFVSGQVITSGTNPLAKDTQYVAIQRFQKDMEEYLRK